MRLASLITGEPFKAAIRVWVVFVALYALSGFILVRAVENTLRSDLVGQTRAETLLLQNIYQTKGRRGLVRALQDIERSIQIPDHAAGLFDENGIRLTGAISVFPDFVGVERRELHTLTRGRLTGQYFLNVQQFDRLTLVVGRNGQIVDKAEDRLTLWLTLFGVALSTVILTFGLWASRTSLMRLQGMEQALRQVSGGDLTARLPVNQSDDQFDRIAVQMNQNLDRLARLMTGMKSTASAVAHDLKTPLSHVQISLMQAVDAAEAQRDPLPELDAALSEVESLNAVFETVLRISRIQATSDKSKFKQIDLMALAEKLRDFMQPAIELREQEIKCSGEPLSVQADPDMIQQLLVNLINNASEHSHKGTQITIDVQPVDGAAILSVQDNGPGIPETELDKVLDPFVRLDSARTKGGSGLGLSLVQAIAEHHNAELSLTNLNPGLNVALQFPVQHATSS
ncbi:Sensor protein BasS [Roseovarius albus]|uniref:histidine kinase n=1 Tax=Roseovarius albus TaxID=1247867 RepID=A0A1X6Y6W1_9RHOB|nr:HAMP domain-containing sensor histidine kinase [Roseovarius albus]SLN11757.1 Sensor protein BasS [Roseovarius albus]